MKKLPPEGSVFLVPLRDYGFAIGVLARVSGEGHCFGYFFGPRIQSKDDIDFDSLTPRHSVLVGKFGDLELFRGNWKVIAQILSWKDNRWGLVPLARVDELSGRAWLSIYDDDFNCVQENEITTEEASKYPYDRMMGAGSVEIRLTQLLSDG